MGLLSIFGLAKKKAVTPPTFEQLHMQFIEDTCTYYDLPWDGFKRLLGASDAAIEDIKNIRALSEREHENRRPRMNGVPLYGADLFWQHRIGHTAMVMNKLDYTPEETKAHTDAIRKKHTGTHFPPTRPCLKA